MSAKKSLNESIMERLGFEIIGTGGGCDAYYMRTPNNMCDYILVTSAGGGNIPTRANEWAVIGFYKENDGDVDEKAWLGIRFDDILHGKLDFGGTVKR